MGPKPLSNMRIIDKTTEKIKEIMAQLWFDEALWIIIIGCALFAAFSAGSLYERHQIKKQYSVQIIANPDAEELWADYQRTKISNTTYFASKNGSVAYPVGCSKGDRVKEENRVFFATLDEAINQGYREVDDC